MSAQGQSAFGAAPQLRPSAAEYPTSSQQYVMHQPQGYNRTAGASLDLVPSWQPLMQQSSQYQQQAAAVSMYPQFAPQFTQQMPIQPGPPAMPSYSAPVVAHAYGAPQIAAPPQGQMLRSLAQVQQQEPGFPEAPVSARTELAGYNVQQRMAQIGTGVVPPAALPAPRHDPSMPPLPIAESSLPSPVREQKVTGDPASAANATGGATRTPLLCVAQVLIDETHPHFQRLVQMIQGKTELQLVLLPKPEPHIWLKAVKTGTWYWDQKAMNFIRGYLSLVNQASGAQARMVVQTSRGGAVGGNMSQAFADPTSHTVVGTTSGKVVSASDFGMAGTSFSAQAPTIANDPRYQNGKIDGASLTEWYAQVRDQWKDRTVTKVYQPSDLGDGSFVTM